MKLSVWIFVAFSAPALSVAPARALDANWRDCVQENDHDLGIWGCSQVLARGSAETQKNRAIAYYNRGVAYYAKGENDRAIVDYSDALRLDPKYVDAYNNRGRAYFAKGDKDRAFADFSETIRLNPKYAFAYNNRGLVYYGRGDNDRAISDYSAAIRLDPKYVDAYNSRGNAYYAKGDKDRAFADYSEAIRLDPKFAFAHHNRGLVYYAKGDKDRAIADYSAAIRFDPKYVDAYNDRGNAYYAKGDYDDAIADYSVAIRLNPNYALPYYNRGNAYHAKKDNDRAIADHSEAIRLDPKYADALGNRGLIFEARGDATRARADFEAALAVRPGDKVGTEGLARLSKSAPPSSAAADWRDCAQEKDHDLGIRGCTLVLARGDAESSANRAIAYYNRGNAYSAKGDYDRAIADHNEAIRLDPKYANALGNRGIIYEARGDIARARADFEAALAARPGDKVATEGLARLAKAAPPSSTVSAPVNAPLSCAGLGKRVALVVGISAYPNAALPNPVNDADDVSRLLKERLCFDVIEVRDATRAAFEHAIAEISRKAEGADVALFYYAGHGMQFQQTNYLLPIDASLSSEYEAIHGNISAQDVITTLEARAKVTLAFLDACRNNPLEEEFKRRMTQLGRGYGEDRGLAPMKGSNSQTLVVFATRPNQRAADGTGRNSPFTAAFLQHIATPGEDIELVMRDVAAEVREKTDGKQVPQRLTELQQGLTLAPAK